ncbi:MAG: transglycosylase SLT domain-containing protein, partial [Coriobacteriia bacterium]|nr:transglycosylase SLT domain-containing protein [Coriobacteriia bacterium]
GNRVTAENDYRVLGPRLVTDANQNRTAVAFDALGMPVRTAVMGKEGASEGDTLDDPTTRVEYDLHRYARTQGTQPAFVHTFAREQHGPDNPRWQESYSYTDGSGREVMRKVQAAPGDVPARGPDGRVLRDETGAIRTRHETRRWIGTGRTVFDNKGNAVKKYEPFFSDTFEYESERALVEWGVTPILRYDPLGRLVRTDLPNGTFRKVVFDAWGQTSWDENDTVLESRWYRDRGAPDPQGPEPRNDPRRRAAWLAAQHANTPTRSHVDALGRAFLAEADNRDPTGLYRTRSQLDVSGNALAVIDARGNRALEGQVFDMLGRMLFTRSADAGWSRSLSDVTGKPLRAWDARGHELRYRYDALQRPTHVLVRPKHGHEALVGRLVYGEAHPEAAARNLRGRAYQTYDGAGVATSARFDFKGNPIEASRRLAREYRETIDWSVLAELDDVADVETAAAAQLAREVFTTSAEYDAVGRVVSQTAPDASETRPTYHESNQPRRVEVRLRGAAEWTTFVEHVDYDARGQRTRAAHGNGTVCSYEYDAETFRLTRLATTRGGALLQDLRYEYDPVGNIAQVTDAVSFGNPDVSADGVYVYDPLYRLVSAEGREHPGQQPSFADPELVDLAHPHDLAALRRYRETYSYDDVGNIQRMAHRPVHGAEGGWVRRYAYADGSNRLLRTSGPDDDPATLNERYAYDAHGSMTSMPHLAKMRWDYADRLAHVDREGGGHVYFAYDAGGERVRKVYEHSGIVEERIYLDGFEVYRKRRSGAVELERETLHVTDGARRMAMVETTTLDGPVPAFAVGSRIRYQLDNYLGSAVLEVDEAGQVISYEEYLPFGAAAFRAGRHGTGLSAKRYRYTGKERDEETGLCYHGARYYAAWLGRWTAADPAGFVDGVNVYSYGQSSPITLTDPSGLDSQRPCSPDRDDPLNYSTFEEYRTEASSPWSTEYLQNRWDEAHPKQDESTAYSLGAHDAEKITPKAFARITSDPETLEALDRVAQDISRDAVQALLDAGEANDTLEAARNALETGRDFRFTASFLPGPTEEDLVAMAIIESGGNKDVGTNRFGYSGLMQLGKDAAKTVGMPMSELTGGQNVENNVHAAAELWKKNAKSLASGVPRNLLFMYLAHQQGRGGTNVLWRRLQRDPDMALTKNQKPNLPTAVKKTLIQEHGLVTQQDFFDYWRGKIDFIESYVHMYWSH